MMIETAPPAENRLREDPKRGNYVYAPEAGSFFALLSALNDTSIIEEGDLKVDGEAGDTVETDGTVSEDQLVTTENDEATETPEGDPATAEDSTTTAPPTTGAETVPVSTTTTPEAALPTQGGTPATAPPTTTSTPLEEVTTPVTDTSKESRPALLPVVPATTDESDTAPDTNVTDTEDGVDLTIPKLNADTEETLADDGAAADTRFPRTLNAHLAEKALRPLAAALATSQQSMAGESLEATLADQVTVADEALPDSAPPAPQSMATELGGVKIATQTPTPRIPLTNLPGEIAQQIHLIQQQGSSTIRLRLSPENLGEIRLEVHRSGKTVRVTMISKNPLVRDALDGQLADLRDALDKQGFTLEEASVEDSPTGEGDNRPLTWDFPQQEHAASDTTAPQTNAPLRHTEHTPQEEIGLNVLA